MTEENNKLFKTELSALHEVSDRLIETQKKLPSLAVELTAEEQGLLSVCFKNATKAVRIATLIEKKVENKEGEEKIQIEKELRDICSDILNYLDEHLIPFASTNESRVFYQKMKGDYHRYLSELAMGTDCKYANENATKLPNVVDLNVINAYTAYANCSTLNDSLKLGRYDETFTTIKKLGSLNKKLTNNDRNVLNIAFKGLMKNRTTSWQIIASIEQELRQVLIYLGQFITPADCKDVPSTSCVASSDILLNTTPASESVIKLAEAEDCHETVETMDKIDMGAIKLWEYAQESLIDDEWIAQLTQLGEEREDTAKPFFPESVGDIAKNEADNKVKANPAEDCDGGGINEVANENEDLQTQLNNLFKMFHNHKKETKKEISQLNQEISQLNQRISHLETERNVLVPRVKNQHFLIKLLYSIAHSYRPKVLVLFIIIFILSQLVFGKK